MRKDNNMIIQLQRYYALWKECTAMYEEWSKDQGLLIVYIKKKYINKS